MKDNGNGGIIFKSIEEKRLQIHLWQSGCNNEVLLLFGRHGGGASKDEQLDAEFAKKVSHC